tara:strand:+ start:187 stop:552 length:366 start_codon:yes stop_codon:yes gene_type:complete
MSKEYDDNVVDLAAFRKQKEEEEEEAEKARIQQEVDNEEEIQYMRYLLGNIMDQLGDPTKTGTLFYVPMSDEEYYNHYTFESGYNDEGYYESTWEWDGPSTDEFYYDIYNKENLEDDEEDI